MNFIIIRSSDIFSEKPPCENAKLLTPDAKEYEDKTYGITINSLEELIKLKKEVGHSIIISNHFGEHDFADMEIEIYDTYRE